MWKNSSLVMIVSYCPKPNKNVLLVSTEGSESDLCEALHKKPVVIDFYNSQKCGADIVNQMPRNFICQLSTTGVYIYCRSCCCKCNDYSKVYQGKL